MAPAHPHPAAASTARISATLANGRATSWTSTRSPEAASTSLATLAWRVAPPATLGNSAVTHDELGKPAFAFAPALADYLAERGLTAHLSISDEQDFALAFVVIERA